MIEISTDSIKASKILVNGDVLAIPTETVYGLAANIYNEKAVRKIFEIKNRPLYNPLIVHCKSIEQVETLVAEFPEKAKKLAESFWPGPLTLVLKKKSHIPGLVTAGKDTVAIRIPNHRKTLDLLELVDFPLAAPSANPFGCISPTNAQHVASYFPNELSMVLDGGQCVNGVESTIIGFENNEPILYRLGSIPITEIEDVVGKIRIANTSDDKPAAPGMLSKHYAPKTPFILTLDVSTVIKETAEKRIALLLFNRKLSTTAAVHQEILSEKGDLKEAAARLYQTLHSLDRLNFDLIIAEYFPDQGLGKTINDRLERAATK